MPHPIAITPRPAAAASQERGLADAEERSTGTTTLVLNYARSFEPDTPPAKTATFNVTITD